MSKLYKEASFLNLMLNNILLLYFGFLCHFNMLISVA